jgi:peptidoglycan/xylan/chitin deacetylase (PgdA/CDA1 family)
MTGFAGKIGAQTEYLLKRFRNQSMNLIDPPIIVLVYHRVTTLQSDPEMLAVTPENFRKQMQHLKDTVPIIRFEEDWQAAVKPAVAVTFDDGYADNFLEALPILEEVGVPATFFVSTGTIGTRQEFWWHELEHIILEGSNLPGDFTLIDDPTGRKWPTASDSERLEFYHEMVRLLNQAETGRRDIWLAQIRLWAGSAAGTADTHRAMTVDEMQLLAASSLVTIGAHTVNHAHLSSLTPPAQKEEIVASKRQLESWLDREITVFSYPFGQRCDYSKESVALCREAGFTKAAANFPGQAHRWTDSFQIPRQLVRDWPVDIFAQKLKRFWRS